MSLAYKVIKQYCEIFPKEEKTALTNKIKMTLNSDCGVWMTEESRVILNMLCYCNFDVFSCFGFAEARVVVRGAVLGPAVFGFNKTGRQLRSVYRALIFGNKRGACPKWSVRMRVGCSVGKAAALCFIVVAIISFFDLRCNVASRTCRRNVASRNASSQMFFINLWTNAKLRALSIFSILTMERFL